MTRYTKDGKYISFGGLTLYNPHKIPRDGLVAEWLFDGNTFDTSNYNNYGTLVNNPILSTGKDNINNTAYEFDSSIQFIEFEDQPQYDMENFTISLWVKMNELNRIQGLISKAPATGYVRDFWIAFREENVINFSVGDGVDVLNINSEITLNTTDWYHIIGIKEKSGLTYNYFLYINNELEGFSLNDINSTYTDTTIGIGRVSEGGSNSGRYLNGKIDNVRIYNRVLSPDEMTKLYNE